MKKNQDILMTPLRDVRDLIGAENLARLRQAGLLVIGRRDFFTLIGDEKAAAASVEYATPKPTEKKSP